MTEKPDVTKYIDATIRQWTMMANIATEYEYASKSHTYNIVREQDPAFMLIPAWTACFLCDFTRFVETLNDGIPLEKGPSYPNCAFCPLVAAGFADPEKDEDPCRNVLVYDHWIKTHSTKQAREAAASVVSWLKKNRDKLIAEGESIILTLV